MTATPQSSSPPKPRRLIDGSVIFFIVLAAVAALAVFWLKGWDALVTGIRSGLWLLVTVAPMIVVGLFLGGLTRELADPERVAPLLGAKSGWFGLILATGLGAITPGGPFAAFPIVYALFLAGADVGAVIAYLTAWSVLALHRVIVWEIPLLGPEFSLLRTLASLPLPVLAGALARILARGPLHIEAIPPPPGKSPPAAKGAGR